MENALEQLLADPRGAISAKDVRGVLDAWQALKEEWRSRAPLEVRLEDYDALLGDFEEAEEESEKDEQNMPETSNLEVAEA